MLWNPFHQSPYPAKDTCWLFWLSILCHLKIFKSWFLKSVEQSSLLSQSFFSYFCIRWNNSLASAPRSQPWFHIACKSRPNALPAFPVVYELVPPYPKWLCFCSPWTPTQAPVWSIPELFRLTSVLLTPLRRPFSLLCKNALFLRHRSVSEAFMISLVITLLTGMSHLSGQFIFLIVTTIQCGRGCLASSVCTARDSISGLWVRDPHWA